MTLDEWLYTQDAKLKAALWNGPKPGTTIDGAPGRGWIEWDAKGQLVAHGPECECPRCIDGRTIEAAAPC